MSSLNIFIKNNLKNTIYKDDGVKQTNRFCEFLNFLDISWKILIFLPKILSRTLTSVKLILIPYYVFNNKLHV